MGHIIAVVNQKGGVGKTTTVMNLAAYLSSTEGKKCLVVDLDPQANATSGLGLNPTEVEQGTYEVLLGSVPPTEAVCSFDHRSFYILPANMSLAGANVELVSLDDREYFLQKQIHTLKDQYDFILIDCPPSLGLLTINGLTASDAILIPVQAEYFALEGIGQLLDTIGRIQEQLKPDLEVLGALITMYDRRYNLSQAVLQELYRHFPKKIFRTVIPRSVRLAEAPSHGKTIHEYDSSSRGARAYERLAREFVAHDFFSTSIINSI
ncbi:ParA family protein [Candidatus Uhrbacteria bacterium]|nr:ParA family protein [Candidatus Uhrbacteria bacterium]